MRTPAHTPVSAPRETRVEKKMLVFAFPRKLLAKIYENGENIREIYVFPKDSRKSLQDRRMRVATKFCQNRRTFAFCENGKRHYRFNPTRNRAVSQVAKYGELGQIETSSNCHIFTG